MISLEEKILNDLDKTGFITELEIGEELHKKGWQPSHGQSYEDLDSNISREIDIHAHRHRYSKKANLYLTLYLIIEVKKDSKRPWVVFTTKERFLGGLGWRNAHVLRNHRIPLEGSSSSRARTLLNASGVIKNNPKVNYPRVGKAYHEAFKDPGEKSKIYESLISASKATFYLRSLHDPGKEHTEERFNPKKSVEASLYLPVVVLDGNLYEVYLSNKGEKVIEKVGCLPIQFNFSSPNYGETSYDRDLEFFPDIVTKENLGNYLLQLEAWFESMFSAFELNAIEARGV